jgi:hypothetical protein
MEIQATVDDATVIETLKQAYFACRSDRATASDPVLQELTTYSRAALFRHKNFVPAWKTPEEYRDAIERMTPDISTRIRRALDRGATLTTGEDSKTFLRAVQRALSQSIDTDPVVGFNSLVDALLSRAAPLAHLTMRLNSVPSEEHGFWSLYYAGYGLRKSPADRIELYAGERAVGLYDRSPLVRAVADADASRIKLFAFFFYPSHDFGGRDADSASTHRGRVAA